MEKNNLILENGITVLDFFAEWCGPCRGLTPIINELIEDYSNDETVKIVKINVDEQPEIANQFSVRGIPNVVFIKNGELVNRFSGAKGKKEIQDIIDNLK
jgi:thioredoxin 1